LAQEVTVGEIAAMDTSVAQSLQSPLNLILPIKSWLELKELGALMQFKERDMVDGREELRTLHFARFVELHDHNQL
jgi:hypothetical protein